MKKSGRPDISEDTSPSKIVFARLKVKMNVHVPFTINEVTLLTSNCKGPLSLLLGKEHHPRLSDQGYYLNT